MTDRRAPFTRRALGLSAASALIMTAVAAGPAQAERVLDSHPEWLFVTLSAVDAPSGEDTLQTTGFVASGISGVRDWLSHNQTLRRSSGRIQTEDGRWFTLDETTPTLEMFGAIGDGPPHSAPHYFENFNALQIYPFAKSLGEELDWLGWQAVLNHGGGIDAHAGTYFMCTRKPISQQPLSVVAGQSWGKGFDRLASMLLVALARRQHPLQRPELPPRPARMIAFLDALAAELHLRSKRQEPLRQKRACSDAGEPSGYNVRHRGRAALDPVYR